MTMEATRLLFGLAAAAKAVGDVEDVDETFLTTVCEGIPDGVRVVYLLADRDEPPVSLEGALYYDIFLLEMEGEEGQTMPVPLLRTLDPQLAQSLFAAAEFRQLAEEDDDDWDAEDAMELGGDEPWGDLDDDDWEDDDD